MDVEIKRVTTHQYQVCVALYVEVTVNDLGEILSTHIHTAEVRTPGDMSEDDSKRVADNSEAITRTVIIQAASNIIETNRQG